MFANDKTMSAFPLNGNILSWQGTIVGPKGTVSPAEHGNTLLGCFAAIAARASHTQGWGGAGRGGTRTALAVGGRWDGGMWWVCSCSRGGAARRRRSAHRRHARAGAGAAREYGLSPNTPTTAHHRDPHCPAPTLTTP